MLFRSLPLPPPPPPGCHRPAQMTALTSSWAPVAAPLPPWNLLPTPSNPGRIACGSSEEPCHWLSEGSHKPSCGLLGWPGPCLPARFRLRSYVLPACPAASEILSPLRTCAPCPRGPGAAPPLPGMPSPAPHLFRPRCPHRCCPSGTLPAPARPFRRPPWLRSLASEAFLPDLRGSLVS